MGAVVCVSCDETLVAELRHHPVSVIKPRIDDFDKMNWLETITTNELLLWEKVSFEISVITTCRMDSLKNLITSILRSSYLGDRVNLHVSVDTEATSECLDFLESIKWQHGAYNIRRRIRPSGGAQVAVPEGLGATGSSGHYGISLEDDVSVSSEFYSWLKFVALQLENSAQKVSKRIFSISLYSPRVIETGTERREWIDYEAAGIGHGSIFLYEVPCSWGSAFSAHIWREALSYFEKRLKGEELYEPIPKSRVNGWSGSWKKWLIELGYYEHFTTVYPWFEGERSFSTNLLKKGQHITLDDSEADMYTVPLFDDNSWYNQLLRKRLFPVEKTFNLWFKRT